MIDKEPIVGSMTAAAFLEALRQLPLADDNERYKLKAGVVIESKPKQIDLKQTNVEVQEEFMKSMPKAASKQKAKKETQASLF